ncbi:helix-hairpin-helix domain-containing protein [Caldisericum exile]|uniref:Competence protein ComEA n=1 Tax=Caldisericum exile (strain DSM 21853 / NBRC 104410 / AZM16c01) TaxID=511051 RepID=A0A7U6GEK4_CALEA|nr:helix-hairpin-helix domain-containing protein [Caldisericum exile]BAL80970.1 putative competence protein ComEA [Caldisericum exile AZM16c01]
MDTLDTKKIIIILILLIFISFGIGLYVGKTYLSNNKAQEQPVIVQNVGNSSQQKIKVYVTGEVKHPDVYELEENAIVKDAISLAGGVTENADLISINLAKKLTDGEEVIVPSKDNSLLNSNNSTSLATTPKTNKVNINKATKEELMTLPGIGEAKAQAIIDYRTKNGPFKTIHDIVNVSGIGEKTFEKIQDLITV